jgi:hypothetical protein
VPGIEVGSDQVTAVPEAAEIVAQAGQGKQPGEEIVDAGVVEHAGGIARARRCKGSQEVPPQGIAQHTRARPRTADPASARRARAFSPMAGRSSISGSKGTSAESLSMNIRYR